MKRPVVNHRLPVLGSAYKPPATRQQCIDGTHNTSSREKRQAGHAQCCAFECPHNLLVEHSVNVAGRRHHGVAPPWTFRGDVPSASAPSCTLDVVDANPAGMPASAVADILGIHKRRVEQIVAAWREQKGAVEVMRLHSNAEIEDE